MRKVLLLLCFLGISLSLKAQLFGKDWDPGYYYDKNGQKHTGLLADYIAEKSLLGVKGNYLYFKTDKKAEKIKVKAVDIQSFIIKQDTSAIIDSFTVSGAGILHDAPFLKVLVNEPVKLYVQLSIQRSAPGGFGISGIPVGLTFSYNMFKKAYYFGPDAARVEKLEKKNFIEAMSQVMASKPEVVTKIKDKIHRYRDIEELVYYFNNGFYPIKDYTR
jgi:hypothetical protein